MAIQSEAALETGLVQTLQQMSYEYIQIDEGTNLKENFKRQLEIHNKKQLAEHGRSLIKFYFILKVVLVLKRLKNFEIFLL